MKVLILGATGFIGRPAAQAFVRNGHEVYGQTRSADKAKLLEAEEVIPVVADPAKPEEWIKYAEAADVVVDCIGGSDIRLLSQQVFAAVESAAKKARGAQPPTLTYIYCSGTWVHGEDRENTTSERSPAKNTTQLVSWRPEQEQRILSSTTVDGIVVRPALLYGRSGSILTMMFAQAGRGAHIEWPGEKGGRWSLIHVDDLSDLFVRLAEAGPVCKGLIFDAANEFSESVDDILESVTRVSGSAGWSYRPAAHVFEQAITTTTLLRPSLARSLVGWRCMKPGLVDGMKIYYSAYKAANANDLLNE